MLRDALTRLLEQFDKRLAELPSSSESARRHLRESEVILRRVRDSLDSPDADRSKQSLEIVRALILGAEGGIFGDKRKGKSRKS
jgi:hypothetical protein